jgi:hypothetical protein
MATESHDLIRVQGACADNLKDISTLTGEHLAAYVGTR